MDEKEKDTTEIIETLPATTENNQSFELVVDEAGVDEEFVNEVVTEIKNIFHENATNTMLQVGRYIIKQFYDGDNDLAEKKKSPKGKSLLRVMKELNQNRDDNPSESWIYNSINLVVDNDKLKEIDTWRNLSLSCKVQISKVKGLDLKIKLSKKAYSKNLTVRQLRDEINKEKGSKPSLVRFIKNQKSIDKCRIDSTFSDTKLSEQSDKQLVSVKKAIKEQIKTLEKIIKDKTKTLDKYKQIKEKVESAPTKK